MQRTNTHTCFETSASPDTNDPTPTTSPNNIIQSTTNKNKHLRPSEGSTHPSSSWELVRLGVDQVIVYTGCMQVQNTTPLARRTRALVDGRYKPRQLEKQQVLDHSIYYLKRGATSRGVVV